ncbi:cell division control protein 42 homolog [Mizuhopecten yessoensis]|uniref:Ras-related C3 botulinum toxin substrate 1 n=1 Tax=Mizuhopecten yessoensis TaxID=6573 RepID=A0A210Q478_MIZYE|nr:cell division control protein 42 homolog [Mizuhopecten yessoensis]OWF43521.1 Ras-related C3 botulinum toxin substrate 1 [Mizuhopecten yessoensis]
MVTKRDEGDDSFTAGEGEVKCVVVGDGGVGKTSMVLSYSTGKIMTEYQPTCFDSYTVPVPKDEGDVLVMVMDPAGQDTYDRLRTLSYFDTDIFLVCFAVDDKDSLDNVRTKWVPEIREYRPNTPFILVGTQTDLRGSVIDITDSCVTTQQGRKMARRLGAIKYMECSSLDGVGLEEIFRMTIRATTDRKKKRKWNSFKSLFRRKSILV